MNFHLTPNPEKSNDKISEKLKKSYFFLQLSTSSGKSEKTNERLLRKT